MKNSSYFVQWVYPCNLFNGRYGVVKIKHWKNRGNNLIHKITVDAVKNTFLQSPTPILLSPKQQIAKVSNSI